MRRRQRRLAVRHQQAAQLGGRAQQLIPCLELGQAQRRLLHGGRSAPGRRSPACFARSTGGAPARSRLCPQTRRDGRSSGDSQLAAGRRQGVKPLLCLTAWAGVSLVWVPRPPAVQPGASASHPAPRGADPSPPALAPLPAPAGGPLPSAARTPQPWVPRTATVATRRCGARRPHGAIAPALLYSRAPGPPPRPPRLTAPPAPRPPRRREERSRSPSPRGRSRSRSRSPSRERTASRSRSRASALLLPPSCRFFAVATARQRAPGWPPDGPRPHRPLLPPPAPATLPPTA